MRSKRSRRRLHLSSHAKVRSTGVRHAWLAAVNHRCRPRWVCWRWRGFAALVGRLPALKLHWRLALASKPPSRLREAPLTSTPPCVATGFKACSPLGRRTIAGALTGATGAGAQTYPGLSVIAMTCSPGWCVSPEDPSPSPLFGPRCWSRHPGARWVSRCFSTARGCTLARNACQRAPASAHVAKTRYTVVSCMAGLPWASCGTGQHFHGLPV